MSILFQRLYWTLESQWWVVQNHAPMLETCATAGSFTARLISIWAPLMCFPQWFAIGMGTAEGYAIFAARYSAMCIVRYLDGKIPCTRALGICHISALGPLLLWLVLGRREDRYEQGDISASFLSMEIKIIALCVFMDIRDFLLHIHDWVSLSLLHSSCGSSRCHQGRDRCEGPSQSALVVSDCGALKGFAPSQTIPLVQG
eukprot:Sro3488_g348531.3  (201) ;mRNA; f:3582-4311